MSGFLGIIGIICLIIQWIIESVNDPNTHRDIDTRNWSGTYPRRR